MSKLIVVLPALLFGSITFSQSSSSVQLLLQKGDSLYKAKEYLRSAKAYGEALRRPVQSNKTAYYNAACSWALAGQKDSAFYYLDIAVTKKGYENFSHITADKDLVTLHNDKRWPKLLKVVKRNKRLDDKKHNLKLQKELDLIYYDDQRSRNQIDSVIKRHGTESDEWKSLLAKINLVDSLNEIKVARIFERHGWVGPNSRDGEKISANHSRYLFLILQHSKLETQIKYLPLLREAISKGNARPRDYAYVQDRILMRQGLRQLYGTQLSYNPEAKKQFVWPIEDIRRLDERRKEIGMESMKEYARFYFELPNWSIETYETELPEIESFLRKGNGIKY